MTISSMLLHICKTADTVLVSTLKCGQNKIILKEVQKYLENSKNTLESYYTLSFCQLVVSVIIIYIHRHFVNGMLMQVKSWLY